MEIYVNDVRYASWTSSGTITGFETVDLGTTVETIELRGVLSPWSRSAYQRYVVLPVRD